MHSGSSSLLDLNETSWRNLIDNSYSLDHRLTMGDVYLQMRSRDEEFVAIVADQRPVGLCSRGYIGFLMGSLYGHSVYSRKCITEHLVESYLTICEGTTWAAGIQQALSRPQKYFHDDVIICDADGKYLGLITVCRLVGIQSSLLAQNAQNLEDDIVKRNKVEEELRDSNKRLEEVLEQLKFSQTKIVQNERLSALGQMSSGIAHDFNNMLTPILGYCDLLIRSPEYRKDSEKVLRYARIISTAASDAAKIITRLRKSYRPRVGNEKFARINVNEIISDAIELTQPLWKNQAHMRGINISIHNDFRSKFSVDGNAAELREAMTNLIFNAVDAIHQGGEITLRTYDKDSFVFIDVCDNGIGMNEEVQRRCLEPFYSTKGERGTGLGLTMVFGIIQRHGGEIDIESTSGKGTRFSIRIPVSNANDSSMECIVSSNAPKPLRILAVDDEPMVLEIVSALLSEDLHIIETATNGTEALEKLKHNRFDVLLTDRCMPEMNGDEVADRAKLLYPDLPIIMLSGVCDFMSAPPNGVNALIGKPVSLDVLRKTIIQVIQQA